MKQIVKQTPSNILKCTAMISD